MEHNDYYMETIDLGKLVEALLRQWRLIVTVTLLCAFAAGLTSVLLPKTYKTSALVSSTRQISTVSFGSQIETLSEEELQYSQGNYASRMESYAQMVKNPAIAQKVLNELGDKVPTELQEEGELLKKVDGELISQSDSVAIRVTCSDPVLAAEIANAWARYYVEHLNSIYAASGNGEVTAAVQNQVAEYRSSYNQAQTDLEEFLTQNKSSELQRQINELETTLTNLQKSQTDVVNTTISKMVEHDMTVMDNYFAAAAQNQNYLLNEYNQRYEALSRLTSLLDAAENMRAQVQNGGQSAAQSNALALIILKVEAFSVFESSKEQQIPADDLSNIELQTDLGSFTPEQMLSDLDSLVSVLEEYKTNLEAELLTLSQELASSEEVKTDLEILAQKMRSEGALGTSEEFLAFTGVEDLLPFGRIDTPLQKKIADIEQQIRALQAELEDAQAQKRELTHTRDLNWNTYQDLKTKSAELDVSANASNRAVSLAVTAPVPTANTVSSGKITTLAAFAGLMLSVVAIFMIEFWWNYKDIESTPITLKTILSNRGEEN